MNIVEQIELFRQKRLPYICAHILNPPNNHHSIIGEWGRWWIEDTNKNNTNRGIFDESIGCEGRRADIMFLEETSDNLFEINGVAEIENNNNTIDVLKKLDTLKIYDELSKKFPDLKFVILCNTITINDDNKDHLSSILKYAQKKSEDSDLFWIIYIIKIFKNFENHREFNISDSNLDDNFEYKNQSSYVILQYGKIVKKENYP